MSNTPTDAGTSPESLAVERCDMIMALMNRHHTTQVLRHILGPRLTPTPKLVDKVERVDVFAHIESTITAPGYPGGPQPSQAAGEVTSRRWFREEHTTEVVPPPPDGELDKWLAKHLHVQLQFPISPRPGHIAGFVPVVVSWPQMDGHYFPVHAVFVEVAPRLQYNSDVLDLIQRINLFREIRRGQGHQEDAFAVYTRPTSFRFLLDSQGIGVFEAEG